MKPFPLLFSLALAGIIFSCKKKEDPQPPTRTELLAAGKWQVRSSSLEGQGQPTVDIYALASPCSKDDFYQYQLPNTFVQDEGPTKCSPQDPQTQLGVWALRAQDTQLVVTTNAYTIIYTIDELTATSLKVSEVETSSNGDTSTLRAAYININ